MVYLLQLLLLGSLRSLLRQLLIQSLDLCHNGFLRCSTGVCLSSCLSEEWVVTVAVSDSIAFQRVDLEGGGLSRLADLWLAILDFIASRSPHGIDGRVGL